MYRLRRQSGAHLSSYIQQKYLNPDRDFVSREVRVGDVDGLLVYGMMRTERPDWLGHAENLTGITPEVSNTTSAGVLLLPYEEFIYALSWGMGFLTLSSPHLDGGFGIRFAIRKADPKRVRSVTTNAIDALPRTAKTSILGGAALAAFRIEEIGEVLNRLVVAVASEGLSCEKPGKKTWITIRGADALSMPLGKSAEDLHRDIAVVHSVVKSDPVVAGLEHLEDTRQLKSDDPLVVELNEFLERRLAGDEIGSLALSWPSEWSDERGEATRYRFSGFGRGQNGVLEDIELNDVLELLHDVADDQRLKALQRASIQALNNDDDAVSRAISASKWITYETDYGGHRYVYSRGQWYNVGGAYVELLNDRVTRILDNVWDVKLPPWPQKWKKRRKSADVYLGPVSEREYNNLAASEAGRSVTCLDRKLLYTKQHPGGIESCDLLGPDLELVHVKHLDDSVSASHLFNQAQVSAEALRHQVDALERFAELVRHESLGTRDIPATFRPSRVVLAFAGRPATVDSLFTFSQVTLHRCAQRLSDLDVELLVTSIDKGEEVINTQDEAE